MGWRWAAAAALIALPALSTSGTAQDAAEGRRIAEAHCSRCHVIGDYNPMGGIGSTPSFQLMVNKLEDWLARFETFHARLPHPSVIRVDGFAYPDPELMPPNAVPIAITLDDVTDIVAFARTLKE